MGRPRVDPVTRFAERVDTSGDCWIWQGCCNWGGYGRFHDGTREVGAHRFSWAAFVGPIPDGLHIDHLCKQRKCVNPDHLEPVTPQINTLRSENFIAVNARKTHCVRGHPLSGPNLYVCPRGKRECRQCRAEANRKLRPR